MRYSVLLVVGVVILGGVCFGGIGSDESSGRLPTAQSPDLLIFESDTLGIYANPLEPYFKKKDQKRPEEFFSECLSTGCWRDYQAVWEIEEGRLYLLGLHSCCDFEKQYSADRLDSLLSGRYKNGRAWARWFTGTMPAPQGELLKYVHGGYGSVYEREVIFKIEEGHFVGKDTVSNVPTRDPQFPGGLDSLRTYIYRHVKWEYIPRPKEPTSIFPVIKIDTLGRVWVKQVMRADNPETEDEIRRVFENMGRWEVGYYKGEKDSTTMSIPIPFSDSLYRQYTK